MTMLKCKLVPDERGYQIKEMETAITTELKGGRPRVRRDLLNADTIAEVQFTCSPEEYQYLRAFYNQLNLGADAFLIDLMLETSSLREYVATFEPGTWKLSRVTGHRFEVRVRLNVQKNDTGLDYAQLVDDFTPETYVPPPDPASFGLETSLFLLGDNSSNLLLANGTDKLLLGDENG